MPNQDGYSGAETIASGSTASAPGAGATVCSVTILSPGIYELEVNVMLTGAAETLLNNTTLQYGPGKVLSVPSITGLPFRFRIKRAYITAVSTVAVKVTAAATAGTVYVAYITATKVG